MYLPETPEYHGYICLLCQMGGLRSERLEPLGYIETNQRFEAEDPVPARSPLESYRRLQTRQSNTNAKSELYTNAFPFTPALRSESARRLLSTTSTIAPAVVTKSHGCLPGGTPLLVVRKIFESYLSDKETEGITVV